MSTYGVGGPYALKGGPLDGVVPKQFPTGGWLWGDIEGRAHSKPKDGCHAYRQTAWGWVYAGHTHTVCGGCGAYHQVAERCSLCGRALTA